MSLGLVGETGPEVLAHRHEPLLNLHVLGVGCHVPLGDVLADAHQQAKGLNVTASLLLSTLEKKAQQRHLVVVSPTVMLVPCERAGSRESSDQSGQKAGPEPYAARLIAVSAGRMWGMCRGSGTIPPDPYQR